MPREGDHEARPCEKCITVTSRRSLPSGVHSRDPVGSNAPYELRAAPNKGTISASLTAPFGAAISKRLPFGERSRLERKLQPFSCRTGRGPVTADYAHRAARGADPLGSNPPYGLVGRQKKKRAGMRRRDQDRRIEYLLWALTPVRLS